MSTTKSPFTGWIAPASPGALLLLHRSGLSTHTPCQSPGALTRVAACTLALSPIRDTLIDGFSHFVTSTTAPIASGWSESPGGPRTHWKARPFHVARQKRSFTAAATVPRLVRKALTKQERDSIEAHANRPTRSACRAIQLPP